MSSENTQRLDGGRNGVAFAAGILFALGLGIAGMTNPNKVLGFLDVTGDWDPSLAFVMVGAIAVYHVVFRVIGGRKAPRFADRFHWPSKTDVDRPLVVGSVLFGVGWGIGGFCPGPAVVATTSLDGSVLVFFVAMTLGMVAQRWLADRETFARRKAR